MKSSPLRYLGFLACAIAALAAACDNDAAAAGERLPQSITEAELEAADWFLVRESVNGQRKTIDTTRCDLEIGFAAGILSVTVDHDPDADGLTCANTFTPEDGDAYAYRADTLTIARTFNGFDFTDRYEVTLFTDGELLLKSIPLNQAGNAQNGKWHYFRAR